jgi:hypothetical protein
MAPAMAPRPVGRKNLFLDLSVRIIITTTACLLFAEICGMLQISGRHPVPSS